MKRNLEILKGNRTSKDSKDTKSNLRFKEYTIITRMQQNSIYEDSCRIIEDTERSECPKITQRTQTIQKSQKPECTQRTKQLKLNQFNQTNKKQKYKHKESEVISKSLEKIESEEKTKSFSKSHINNMSTRSRNRNIRLKKNQKNNFDDVKISKSYNEPEEYEEYQEYQKYQTNEFNTSSDKRVHKRNQKFKDITESLDESESTKTSDTESDSYKELLNEQSEQSDEEEEKSLTKLKDFLAKNIVVYATEDKRLQSVLLSDKALKTWKVAFTHESYNPNKGENYEELEKLGDKIIGLCFTLYLMEKYPELGRDKLSTISNHYLSKKELSRLSYNLGLINLVRTRIPKNINISEDIFESLFGALFTIGDSLIVDGAGYLLCKRLLYSIYMNVKIDLEVAKGEPKTQVTEIFQKAGWDKINTEWDEDTGTFIIYFSNKAIDDLRKMGIHLSSNVLAKVENKKTKKVAEEEAFKIALERLTNMNITTENVKEIIKRNRDFEHERIKPLVPRLNKKLKERGISSVFFSKAKIRGGKEVTIQLLGIDENTNKKLVLSEGEAEKILDAKIKAIEKFIQDK